MKHASAVIPARVGIVAAAAWLAGCTITSADGFFGGDKVDYRSATVKPQGLEVPPDLTQLARETRYQPQGGVVSAAAAGTAAATAPAAAAAEPATVALNSVGPLHVEREGQQRWLVVPQSPEQLWPQLKSFWEQRGFTLAEEDAQAGVMETNWSENRAKLPAAVTGNMVGRLLSTVFDTGERDRFRTRVERTATGSEVYISHRGIEEVYTSERHESTTWRARPNDPTLEAEFLTRLLVALGVKDEPARAAVAAPVAATPAGTAPGANGAPRAVAQATSIVVNEPFDRAWRRVGLALDRTGFTVEDRDRAAGLYFVRYVDPKNAGKEEPGWWARLFGDRSNPQEALRYRIAVRTSGDTTTVSVLNSSGAQELGDNAQRIVALLTNELR